MRFQISEPISDLLGLCLLWKLKNTIVSIYEKHRESLPQCSPKCAKPINLHLASLLGYGLLLTPVMLKDDPHPAVACKKFAARKIPY